MSTFNTPKSQNQLPINLLLQQSTKATNGGATTRSRKNRNTSQSNFSKMQQSLTPQQLSQLKKDIMTPSSKKTSKKDFKKFQKIFMKKFKEKHGYLPSKSNFLEMLNLETDEYDEDRKKPKELHERINMLYFPNEDNLDQKNERRHQFISYNSILNSDEYLKNAQKLLTPISQRKQLTDKETSVKIKTESEKSFTRETGYLANGYNSFKKLDIKLKYNKEKRDRYLLKMQKKARQSYDKVLNKSRNWHSSNKSDSVKILKRSQILALSNTTKAKQAESARNILGPESDLSKMINRMAHQRHFEHSSRTVAISTKKEKLVKKKKAKRNFKNFYIQEPLTDEEIYKFPSSKRREENIGEVSLCWLKEDEIISKNFDSTEGIGFCYYKGYCYFYGGIGKNYDLKVYTYNTKLKKFGTFEISQNSMCPLGRCFHTMIAYDHKIIMFGGESAGGHLGSRFLMNETWILDLENRAWKKRVENEFGNDHPRKLHQVCLMGKHMIVSGGTTYDDKFLQTFDAFDCENFIWKKVQAEIEGWRGAIWHSMTACLAQKTKDLYPKNFLKIAQDRANKTSKVSFFLTLRLSLKGSTFSAGWTSIGSRPTTCS